MFGVFADEFFVGRDIDAVDLVGGDVAVEPLDLGGRGCGGLRRRFARWP